MNWLMLIVLGAILVAWLLFRRLAFVSEALAQQLLRAGALVLDVRSPAEFQQTKVPGAINLPLEAVREKISQVAPDPQKPLLVHCLSGGRSAIAQRQLQSLGYTQVYNLGSLARAQHLYATSKQPRRPSD